MIRSNLKHFHLSNLIYNIIQVWNTEIKIAGIQKIFCILFMRLSAGSLNNYSTHPWYMMIFFSGEISTSFACPALVIHSIFYGRYRMIFRYRVISIIPHHETVIYLQLYHYQIQTIKGEFTVPYHYSLNIRWNEILFKWPSIWVWHLRWCLRAMVIAASVDTLCCDII